MKFRRILTMAMTAVMSLALCSFTRSSSPSSEEDEFVANLNGLSADLDKENIYGDETVDVENELLGTDISLISEFVTYDETHIELDDAVYQVMPVNDFSISPEEYKELNGGLEYVYNESFDDEFYVNHHKLKYVEDCMSLMNDMVEDGYGFIDGEGELELYENDFARSSVSFPIINFKLRWFKMTFTAGPFASILFGVMGTIINFDPLMQLSNLFYKGEDYFEQFLEWASDYLISAGFDYFGENMHSNCGTVISTFLQLRSIFMINSVVNFLTEILKFIMSHYLPGLIKSIEMILGSAIYQYKTDCEVGLWWSKYDICTLRL